MQEKDLIYYAKTLLSRTLELDDNKISELAYEEIKSKKAILEDVFLRLKNQDKKAIFLAGSPGAGKSEFASGLNKLYKIDVIEADEIRKYCKYYNGKNSDLFKKASLEGVNILMNTVLDKEYSFILDGKFFEFIDSALEKNYDVEVNFVYRPIEIAKEYTKIVEKNESIKISEDIFYKEFINSINIVNKIKKKYLDIKVNFYDLHNDLILKDINNLDEVINKSDVIQNDIKLAIERETKNENRHIK
jgi:hypothetical protein